MTYSIIVWLIILLAASGLIIYNMSTTIDYWKERAHRAERKQKRRGIYERI